MGKKMTIERDRKFAILSEEIRSHKRLCIILTEDMPNFH